MARCVVTNCTQAPRKLLTRVERQASSRAFRRSIRLPGHAGTTQGRSITMDKSQKQFPNVDWIPTLGALIALVGAFGVLAVDANPVSAQCLVCEVAECEEGAGGSNCEEQHAGGAPNTCETSGGCTCVKVQRRFWFDGQACSPTALNSTAPTDVRFVGQDGDQVALVRVGANHFAATACGARDRWSLLARELPDGRLSVTTNPIVIRVQRWALELGSFERVALDQQ